MCCPARDSPVRRVTRRECILKAINVTGYSMCPLCKAPAWKRSLLRNPTLNNIIEACKRLLKHGHAVSGAAASDVTPVTVATGSGATGGSDKGIRDDRNGGSDSGSDGDGDGDGDSDSDGGSADGGAGAAATVADTDADTVVEPHTRADRPDQCPTDDAQGANAAGNTDAAAIAATTATTATTAGGLGGTPNRPPSRVAAVSSTARGAMHPTHRNLSVFDFPSASLSPAGAPQLPSLATPVAAKRGGAGRPSGGGSAVCSRKRKAASHHTSPSPTLENTPTSLPLSPSVSPMPGKPFLATAPVAVTGTQLSPSDRTLLVEACRVLHAELLPTFVPGRTTHVVACKCVGVGEFVFVCLCALPDNWPLVACAVVVCSAGRVRHPHMHPQHEGVVWYRIWLLGVVVDVAQGVCGRQVRGVVFVLPARFPNRVH